MAEAIKKKTILRGVGLPGYIATDFDDIDFLKSVMLQWGQWPNSVVSRHINDSVEGGELDDAVLRKDGYFVAEREGVDIGVTLIKAGVGMWVILGMSFEELEVFAEECEGNLEADADSDIELQQLEASLGNLSKFGVLVAVVYVVIAILFMHTRPSLEETAIFLCWTTVLFTLSLAVVAYCGIRSGRSAKK